MHLLFVCTGNTCRSPLAEGIAHPSDEKHANADQVADELGLLDAKPVVVAAARISL